MDGVDSVLRSPFDVAVEHIRREEGGLVDNPKDPGGRTNFGVTQRLLYDIRETYPRTRWPTRVDDLTWTQARDIYQIHFWLPMRGGDLPTHTSIAVLDAAVNVGVERAVKWMQSAAGQKPDGWIGAKTLLGVRSVNPIAWLNEFSALRAYHYMLQDSIDDTFGLGWARRLFRTYAASREVIQ